MEKYTNSSFFKKSQSLRDNSSSDKKKQASSNEKEKEKNLESPHKNSKRPLKKNSIEKPSSEYFKGKHDTVVALFTALKLSTNQCDTLSKAPVLEKILEQLEIGHINLTTKGLATTEPLLLIKIFRLLVPIEDAQIAEHFINLCREDYRSLFCESSAYSQMECRLQRDKPRDASPEQKKFVAAAEKAILKGDKHLAKLTKLLPACPPRAREEISNLLDAHSTAITRAKSASLNEAIEEFRAQWKEANQKSDLAADTPKELELNNLEKANAAAAVKTAQLLLQGDLDVAAVVDLMAENEEQQFQHQGTVIAQLLSMNASDLAKDLLVAILKRKDEPRTPALADGLIDTWYNVQRATGFTNVDATIDFIEFISQLPKIEDNKRWEALLAAIRLNLLHQTLPKGADGLIEGIMERAIKALR